MAFGILGQVLQKLEPLVPALMRADTGVGFVHDDQAGTRAGKAVAALISLDVVEADNCVRMGVEEGLRSRKTALQAGRRGGGDGYRVQVEFRAQFTGPLLDQMGRTKHGEAIDLAAVDQLP